MNTEPSSTTGKLVKNCFYFCLHFCNVLQFYILKQPRLIILNIIILMELWFVWLVFLSSVISFLVLWFCFFCSLFGLGFFTVPILLASPLLLQYFTDYSLLIWLIFERSSLMFSACKQIGATGIKKAT